MPIVKPVNKTGTIKGIMAYVTKEEKTNEKLLSVINMRSVDTAKMEMMMTKKQFHKEDGRQYFHYVVSFHKDENITPAQCTDFCKELVAKNPNFAGHQIVIAVHKDKDHLHGHIVGNSVNMETGYKYHSSPENLQRFKDLCNDLSREHGYHVPEKGRHYDGTVREDVSIYDINKYKLLEKTLKGKTKSYVYDIGRAVLSASERATDLSQFKDILRTEGINTNWEGKYATFSDQEGHKVRDKNIGKTFNIEKFGKEMIMNGFERNKGRDTAYRKVDGFNREIGRRERELEETMRGVAKTERGIDDIISRRARLSAERERMARETERLTRQSKKSRTNNKLGEKHQNRGSRGFEERTR